LGISLGSKERSAYENNVNRNSLDDLLNKGNISVIISELKQALGTKDLSEVTYTQFLWMTDSDIDAVSRVLK
jgi:DNA gyrase/topoisomerase IV subunit B